jgi:hypothetical protein
VVSRSLILDMRCFEEGPFDRTREEKGITADERSLLQGRTIHVPIRPVISTRGTCSLLNLFSAPSLAFAASIASTSAKRGLATAHPISSILHEGKHFRSVKVKGVADVTESIFNV